MAILRKILFCAAVFGALKHGFRGLATLKLVVNAVCELLPVKNSCGDQRHRVVSLRHHGFLVSLEIVKSLSKPMLLYDCDPSWNTVLPFDGLHVVLT